MRSILARMRSSLLRMRSSLVVRASDCQCTSCNGPGFDPSIRRHSGIWGAADEAVLNTVRKKIPQKIKKNLKINYCVVQAAAECASKDSVHIYRKTRNPKWNSKIVHFLCIVSINIVSIVYVFAEIISFYTKIYSTNDCNPVFCFSRWEKICTHIIRCHEQLFWHSKLEDCFGRIF